MSVVVVVLKVFKKPYVGVGMFVYPNILYTHIYIYNVIWERLTETMIMFHVVIV